MLLPHVPPCTHMQHLRFLSALKLPRTGFLHRFSPDIVRTPHSLILCNNATNELEAYCWRTGQQQGSVSTGMRALDLLHEPRIAGNGAVVCIVEKQVPYIVLRYVSGCNAAVPLPAWAGEPAALAVNSQQVAVVCQAAGSGSGSGSGSDGHRRLVIVLISLHTLEVTCVPIATTCMQPPHSVHFDTSGLHLLLASSQAIVKLALATGEQVLRFGANALCARTGHVGLDYCAQHAYVTDMKGQALHVFTAAGELLTSPPIMLNAPTAVACYEDMIHILDYGKVRTYVTSPPPPTAPSSPLLSPA